MELLLKIGQFLLMISILVILHEFGHYIPAKLFKTKVEKFFLFFDVKFALFKKKIGDTTWGIGWLPLGGYVKIAGMIDESMDREQMAKPEQPWEFRSKPAWQRLIIMCGGVIVNFLLGWLIFVGVVFKHGDNFVPVTKDTPVQYDSIAKVIGFKDKDVLLSVDGESIDRIQEARIEILLGDQAKVLRDGQEVDINFSSEHKKMLLSLQPGIIYPVVAPYVDFVAPDSHAQEIGLKAGDLITSFDGQQVSSWTQLVELIQSMNTGKIGVQFQRNGQFFDKEINFSKGDILGVRVDYNKIMHTENFSFLESFGAGYHKAVSTLSLQIRQFKLIFNRDTGAYKQLHGPVGIIKQTPLSESISEFLLRMAVFSIWLGFVNILPIPALDGGHVMFLIYEMIVGRKPSQKVLELAQVIGFFLMIGLMLAITVFNDL